MTPSQNAPFWGQHLYAQLLDSLAVEQKEGSHVIQRSEKSVVIVQDAIDQLEREVKETTFIEQTEEIRFYKEVKPLFYSHLFFHQRIFHIEINLPPAGTTAQVDYLNGYLRALDQFFDQNKFLYRYLRTGQSYLDDRLFVAEPKRNALSLELYGLQGGSFFPVGFDLLVAAIKASERLYEHVAEAIRVLQHPEGGFRSAKPKLVWTESKTALIELAYALQSSGAFNSGKADLREIIEDFQVAFQVDLGNYPRTFQEILSRKTGYTNFMDKLRERLLLRIKTIEDKHIR
jgi:hypothetical protein